MAAIAADPMDPVDLINPVDPLTPVGEIGQTGQINPRDQAVVEGSPWGFKGIALVTPGGDVVYCRDRQKRSQWHVHLCAALQESLLLPAPPHFLVPSHTATVDRWLGPGQRRHLSAEATPPVLRYQGLLNRLFDLGNLEWQAIYPPPEVSSPALMATYREQVPELWVNHDLVLDISSDRPIAAPNPNPGSEIPTASVLHLFVSGHTTATEVILKTLQTVLEGAHHRQYTLKVIDVSKHPEQAEVEQITATPTLLRVRPLPHRRLVGDLERPQAILDLLSDRPSSPLFDRQS